LTANYWEIYGRAEVGILLPWCRRLLFEEVLDG
jgi:hypothetical protein